MTTGGLREFVADTAEGEDSSLVAVRSELSTAFTVRQEPGAAGSGTHRRTWLDTFDWRLYKAGLTLQLRAGQTGRPAGAEQGRRHAAGRTAGDPLAETPRPGRGPAPRPGPGPDPGPDQPARAAAHRQGGQHGQRNPAAQRRRQDRGPAGRGPRHGHRARRQEHSGRHHRRAPAAAGRGRGPRLPRPGAQGGGPAGQHARRLARQPERVHRGADRARPPSGRLHQRRGRGDHRHHARAGRRGPAAAAPARHAGAERRRGAPRHRHRVPARPAGRGPPHPVGDQAPRRGAARRPGRTLQGRVQVARRRDHAGPGPGRPPARLRRDDRTAGRRVPGRPGAAARLPGQAARPRVPAAGRGAARAAVPRHHRRLAQGAARDPRRGRPPAAASHRGRAGPVHDRPLVPADRRARRRDHLGLAPGIPA